MKIKIIQKVDEWEYSVKNYMSDYHIIYGSTIVIKRGHMEVDYKGDLYFHYNIIKKRNLNYKTNMVYETDDSSYIYSIGEIIKVGVNYYKVESKAKNVNGEVEYILESATVEPENKDQILEKLYKEQESLIKMHKEISKKDKSNIAVVSEPTTKNSLYDYIGGLSALGISVVAIAFFVWVLVSL